MPLSYPEISEYLFNIGQKCPILTDKWNNLGVARLFFLSVLRPYILMKFMIKMWWNAQWGCNLLHPTQVLSIIEVCLLMQYGMAVWKVLKWKLRCLWWHPDLHINRTFVTFYWKWPDNDAVHPHHLFESELLSMSIFVQLKRHITRSRTRLVTQDTHDALSYRERQRHVSAHVDFQF